MLEHQSIPVMEMTGTVNHCGIPLTYVTSTTKWSGILELRTTQLQCAACDAKVAVTERVPVGPPARVEQWRDAALRKARTLIARANGVPADTFPTIPGAPS